MACDADSPTKFSLSEFEGADAACDLTSSSFLVGGDMETTCGMDGAKRGRSLQHFLEGLFLAFWELYIGVLFTPTAGWSMKEEGERQLPLFSLQTSPSPSPSSGGENTKSVESKWKKSEHALLRKASEPVAVGMRSQSPCCKPTISG
jgi:hypothetical protein